MIVLHKAPPQPGVVSVCDTTAAPLRAGNAGKLLLVWDVGVWVKMCRWPLYLREVRLMARWQLMSGFSAHFNTLLTSSVIHTHTSRYCELKPLEHRAALQFNRESLIVGLMESAVIDTCIMQYIIYVYISMLSNRFNTLLTQVWVMFAYANSCHDDRVYGVVARRVCWLLEYTKGLPGCCYAFVRVRGCSGSC